MTQEPKETVKMLRLWTRLGCIIERMRLQPMVFSARDIELMQQLLDDSMELS